MIEAGKSKLTFGSSNWCGIVEVGGDWVDQMQQPCTQSDSPAFLSIGDPVTLVEEECQVLETKMTSPCQRTAFEHGIPMRSLILELVTQGLLLSLEGVLV